jgi:tRNA1(Val) A37 N6-methylase TrmN6
MSARLLLINDARKAAGIFYTPEDAARRLAAETLAPLVAGRAADARPLRVLDPACGEGAILRAAREQLGAAGVAAVLSGVDLDARALEVARRVVPGARLAHGNAVVRDDYARLGLGRELLRQLAARRPLGDKTLPIGGFDAILGNPPYVRPHRIDAAEKAYFKRAYATFRKKSDLFVCFVERALELLRPGGRLGLLTSRSWLTHDSFEALRRCLLARVECDALIECPDDLFPDASVRTVMLVATKKADRARTRARDGRVRVGALVAGGVEWRGTVEPQAFEGGYKAVFDLSLADAGVAEARALVRARARPLGEAFHVCFGLKTGDDARFVHECVGAHANARAHRCAHDRPLVTGEDVARYRVAEPRRVVCYDPAAMRAHRRSARPGDAARFERDKLLVKDTATQLAAAFDGARRYAKDVLIVLPREGARVSLHYLLGVLNSRLMRFYYGSTFDAVHVQKHELESLPVLIEDGGALMDNVAALAARAPDATVEKLLDDAVFRLFAIPENHQRTINRFLERAAGR